MSAWILIIVMYGKTVTMHEFSSEQTCTTARDVVRGATSLIYAVCVEK